jgi:hypothetical protein
MPPTARTILPLGFAGLLLAGCATTESPDEVRGKIERYYAAHATEQDGACPTPEMASVTRRKVLESDADTTRLRVRYSYFDPSRAGESIWSRVLITERPCTGVAERDFTLEQTTLGYRVIGMSGPRRGE